MLIDVHTDANLVFRIRQDDPRLVELGFVCGQRFETHKGEMSVLGTGVDINPGSPWYQEEVVWFYSMSLDKIWRLGWVTSSYLQRTLGFKPVK